MNSGKGFEDGVVATMVQMEEREAEASPAGVGMALAALDEFDGHSLTTVTHKNRLCWIAAEVGDALGYADRTEVQRLINREWADEFEEGDDFLVLRGQDLKDFKRLTEVSGENTLTLGWLKFTPNLMLLTEEGVYAVCLKTNKPAGKRLRKFIKGEVVPQIVRDGVYLPSRQVADGKLVDRGTDTPSADKSIQSLVRERYLIDLVAERQKHACELLLMLRKADAISEQYFLRHTEQSLAMIKGTEPSADRRLVDVSTFLKGKGLSDAQVRQCCSGFGKILKKRYVDRYGVEPGKALRFINGSERYVCSYTDEHLPLMEEAFRIMFGLKVS